MKNKSFSGFAKLQIAFGFVWAIDAYFKWQPAFISGFRDLVVGNLANQPKLIHDWINFWVNIILFNPPLFAILTAVTETVIAVCLIFGIATKYIIYVGIIFSLMIWTIAEGFGGPYTAGSTDIGSAIIYVLFLLRFF